MKPGFAVIFGALFCLVSGVTYLSNPIALPAQQAANGDAVSIQWSNTNNVVDGNPNNAADTTNHGNPQASIVFSNLANPLGIAGATAINGISVTTVSRLDVNDPGLAFFMEGLKFILNGGSGPTSSTRGKIQVISLNPLNQTNTFGSTSDLWGLTSPTVNDILGGQLVLPFSITPVGVQSGSGTKVLMFSVVVSVTTSVTPIVTILNPSSAPNSNGGISVNVSGQNFDTNIQGFNPFCKFGSQTSTATIISRTLLTCVAPAQAVSGLVNLEISLDGAGFTSNGVQFLYSGATNNCPGGCQNGGLCLANLTCSCSAGFTGTNCQAFDCSLVNGCSGHGSCQGPNVCNCFNGYLGLTCATPDCTSVNQCGGNGNCTAPSLCSCFSGYQGAACTEFKCDAPACNQNQDCSGPNVCSCKTGFTGLNCADRIQCPTLSNCNGNGVCSDNVTCVCSSGFGGQDCSVAPIVNPVGPPLALIVGPSAAGALVLAIIVVIIAAVLVRRSRRKPRVSLHEPNYSQIAIVQSFPNYSLSKDLISNMATLEQLLLNDDKLVNAIFEVVDTAEMDYLSKALTFVYDFNNKGGFLLKKLMERDVTISDDEPTLFRANSPVTKCYTQYIRLSSLQYLWSTLAYVISELRADVEESKEDLEKNLSKTHGSILAVSMELDPTKTNDAEHITLNKLQLQLFCQKIFELLFASYNELPSELKWFFQETAKRVAQKFPDSGYKAIGAFAFLRMLCPAIAAPHVYGVIDSPPGETTQRYLVLVSKILTSVANNTLPGQKEAYMSEMTDFIIENQKRLKTFYDKLMEVHASPDLGKRKSFVSKDLKDTCLCYIYAYLVNNQAKVESFLPKDSKKALDDLTEQIGAPPEPKS